MNNTTPRYRINAEEHRDPVSGFMRTSYVIQERKDGVYEDYKYHMGYSQNKIQKFFGFKTKVFDRVELPTEELAQETITRFLVEEAPDKVIPYKKPKKETRGRPKKKKS